MSVSPAMTLGAAGNGLASAGMALSATRNFDLDVSAAFEAQLQIGCTFGTVAGTAGLQVQVFPKVGSTPVNDTIAGPGSFTITAVGSTAEAQSIRLGTGKYHIVLTNLDATNALTLTYATYDLVSSIG
jgi:hypothetical protein